MAYKLTSGLTFPDIQMVVTQISSYAPRKMMLITLAFPKATFVMEISTVLEERMKSVKVVDYNIIYGGNRAMFNVYVL